MMGFVKLIVGTTFFLLMVMLVGISGCVFFCVSLLIWSLTFLFDRKRVILHRFSCYCLAFWSFVIPSWRIKVEGRGKINKGQAYVIVANHQSQLDIMMTALLFCHFKWVSKAEVFRVPIIGWQMALNRYIKIRRGYVNSISKMMDDCESALDGGSSILIFPEGTRSEDGSLNAFKPGALILAQKKKVPVLPVVIYGTRDALSVKSLVSLGGHRIRVKVLDEISCPEHSNMSPEQGSEYVRQLIKKQLALMEKRIELGLS